MQNAIRVGLILAASLVGAAPCDAQTKLYDSFNEPLLNPAKWYGADGGPWVMEAQRSLGLKPGSSTQYALHLMQRAYAPTTADNNAAGGVFGLGFPSPNNVTAAAFTVVVNAITATECATNPSNQSVTSSDFRGTFFNTQTKPTSQLGDVSAAISVDYSPVDATPAIEVVGFAMQCLDSACASTSILSYQQIGTVALGAANSIGLTWDQPNHRFIYTLNGAQTLAPYSVGDTSPPFDRGKTIDVARVVPDCAAKPRPYTAIDVDISNVYVTTK